MGEHGGVTATPTPSPAPARGSRLLAAGAGVLAGVAGVAVSEAVAGMVRLRLSPPYAVAEAVIEVTPGDLALDLIHLFGRWDKPLLLVGVAVGLLLLSALAGVLALRKLLWGHLVFLATGAVGLLAVMTRPGVGTVAVLPLALGVATWVIVLGLLVGPVQPTAGATTSTDRRTFLRRAGLVALGALVVGVGGQLLGRQRRVVEDLRAKLDLPVTGGTVPAGAEVDVPEMPPWRVPSDEFYRIDTAVVVPTVEVDEWRLRIHGMVERELTLTFDDLVQRRLTEDWVTISCVSNEVGGDLVGNAWWSGVRVADLLAEAGVLPEADAVLQTSHDGWNCGTPLVALTDDRNALLAVAMNGQPLPIEHGFPVRMVVPGLYGYVSATKWVVDLEVTRFEDFTAFWTERGWAEQGPVRTQSRIDVPRANHRVMAGEVRVGGVAWAPHTGVSAVEVRLDGGAWTEVELGRVPNVDTWVQWAGTVAVEPGIHTLAVRATDRSGYTQTGVRRDVVPDGATGWHTIEFTAE
jgi:DMSO/TMAO reductase YedYZ molybdopterin-dependent catalytic subunit